MHKEAQRTSAAAENTQLTAKKGQHYCFSVLEMQRVQ